MDRIQLQNSYERSFFKDHGKEIETVYIPTDTKSCDVNYVLLSECPNIKEFVVEGGDVFEFSDGVLYSKRVDSYTKQESRRIEYVSKYVKNLHVEQDVSGISYWYGIENITVDENNATFTVHDNMLLSNNMKELQIVFSQAKEVIIPEGVKLIHYRAFADCERIKKIAFPSTYEWKGWHTPPMEPLWIINENVIMPEIVANGNRATYTNGIVLDYGTPKYYFGDQKCCYLPDTVKHTFGFNEVFKKVESFKVGDDHPTFTTKDGMILDKTETELLFYPKTRNQFSIPPTVDTICSFSASYCNSIETVIIPDSVKTIKVNAFANCEELETVLVSNSDTDVERGAFSGCNIDKGNYLVGVDSGITYDGRSITHLDFYNTKGTFKVREGTTLVHKLVGPCRPFDQEDEYEKITADTLILPESIESIDMLLVPLKTIEVNEHNPYYCSVDGILFSKDMKTLIRYPERHDGEKYTVPNGVEVIAKDAFSNCAYLRNVALPDTVTYIGDEAFAYTMLEKVEMAAKPVYIGESAITPYHYGRISSVKYKDFDTRLEFRDGNTIIPVELLGNWGANKEEQLLAEFIATEDICRKKDLFSKVKTTQYKIFMALYLSLIHGDVESSKYLRRIKKKLADDPIYTNFIN